MEEIEKLKNNEKKYILFQNPYIDISFSKCPICNNKNHQKIIPYMIVVYKNKYFNIKIKSYYCSKCELLIVKESIIKNIICLKLNINNILNEDFLILGTTSFKIWNEGNNKGINIKYLLSNTHLIKDFVTFKIKSGWVKNGQSSI